MSGSWAFDSANKDDVLRTRVTDVTDKDDALLTAKL